ncbi:MAG: Uma2 family endonuclease [Austwickia sp.]|jgi:Uma2 family endonuclease|nr:Uma2 family endonuclease [Austwickia sp.]
MDAMTVLPHGREFTRDDLDAMPHDGNRYELIDGLLIVTPAPGFRHQVVVLELAVRLRTACPEGLQVVTAPFDVALGPGTVLQPDVLVARRADFTERDLPVAPLLAVEVLSPSTRLYDLNHKRARLERAGCTSYWVVDPDTPAVTAWTLIDGAYQQVAHAEAHETFETTTPFPVSLRPADLIGS